MNKGFTLIELMIVVAIVAIIAAIAIPAIFGVANNDREMSVGINGVTEVRCIDGYKFVIGSGGQARQVMDEYGHGVRCDN